jgi:alkylation response protein AidB-like acyl-CoA dehydrogenase
VADADELGMLRRAIVSSLGRVPVDGDVAATWRRVSEIGWADAFLPGRSSAGVAEAVVVADECGRSAVPLAAPAVVVGAAAAMHEPGLGDGPAVWGDTLASRAWRPGASVAIVPGIDLAGQVFVSTGEAPDGRAAVHAVEDLAAAARRVETIDGELATWAIELDGPGWEPRRGADVAFLRRLAMVTAAAQACGLLDRALRSTIEYAHDRVAFGRPIGSFQAVKHLLADVEVGLQGSRALVADATQALDARLSEAGLACGSAARFAARSVLDGLQACVQVHGGIGVTMECELHHLLRRATALRALYLEPFAGARAVIDEYLRTEPAHA